MSAARSPLLMSPDETALWVVDVQDKLLPLVKNPSHVAWNIGRILEAASGMEIQIATTEQYPEALGSTIAELARWTDNAFSKKSFSCAAVEPLVTQLESQRRTKLLLVGLETHVCIQQTALDMLAQGYHVFLAADAMSARSESDHQVALDRIAAAGGVITTTEAILFEWCQVATGAAFELIKPLVRQTPPTASMD